MANVQYTENLTEDQLDAMAGSETLRYQATSFGIARNNKVLWELILESVIWQVAKSILVLTITFLESILNEDTWKIMSVVVKLIKSYHINQKNYTSHDFE